MDKMVGGRSPDARTICHSQRLELHEIQDVTHGTNLAEYVSQLLSCRALLKQFYERNPEVVAKELLGKILVRRTEGHVLSGTIVETEAYYGTEDTASSLSMIEELQQSPLGTTPESLFTLSFGRNN